MLESSCPDGSVNASDPSNEGSSGIPHLYRFFDAFHGRQSMDRETLMWLNRAFSQWIFNGARGDLADALGLGGMAKYVASQMRECRDESLLIELETLVMLGEKPDDAAAIIADTPRCSEGLSATTLERLYKSKHTRCDKEAMEFAVWAAGGEAAYLSKYSDTYMSPKLVSMKRGR
ncbi:hypothetical protein EZ313_21970 [Ramlibacter henchirensis]|uniref:Uncharacterized protein n=1 Tax=Ramlibacter henchirensis TaxID=204072 RepID=A0A4Z0BIV1_9BURK|nr:hypothetical protein [Ramlibacter henchirensis]TFY99236.1 hypothetical protein EZ313_21970 [Ramlibacter henchirensis]